MNEGDQNAQAKLKYEEYKKQIQERTENFVINELPTFIMEIEEVLKKPQFQARCFTDVHQDYSVPTPREDQTSQTSQQIDFVPKNSHVTGMMDVIKPYLFKIEEGCNLLITWMSFQSVKVASGRKTYNIIKSEVVENAHQILLKRSKLFNRYLYYFEDRGELIEEMLEYPEIGDYPVGIDEMDEKMYLALSKHLFEIRNLCSALYDSSKKNLDKIKKPKPEDATNNSY